MIGSVLIQGAGKGVYKYVAMTIEMAYGYLKDGSCIGGSRDKYG